jgi:tetratricopeptide (TPR) repeat protein
MIFVITYSFAQEVTTNIIEDQNIEEMQKNVKDEDTDKIEKLTEDIQDLKTQNAVLTKSLDTLTIFFSIFGGLISIILIFGAITSGVSWNTNRKRSNETYSLDLKKEQESSKRDKSLFNQSMETLTLVNQTLGLARDASERAYKAIQEKLNKKHKALEKEASDLLEESKAHKNFKVLVENSTVRSNLLTLASAIISLQTNLGMLEKEVTLLPHCCFIRGMEFHLNQHFKLAIEYWKLAKDQENIPKPLRITALYWIGYEQNNLAKYEDAALNFELASDFATGPMEYELKRIKIESKSFDVLNYTTEKILPEIESLYGEIKEEIDSKEFNKIKSNVGLTLGNIYFQLGNDLSKNDNKKSILYYEKAKETFYEAPVKSKWIWFGYGESCYKLGDHQKASDILLEKVKNQAEFEYSTRLEPRTKVLCQTTVLICSMRIKKFRRNVDTTYNLIKTILGGVDERLTIYSQLQSRNVLKKQFLKDLDKQMEEFRIFKQNLKIKQNSRVKAKLFSNK